jgi:hypothetical protein
MPAMDKVWKRLPRPSKSKDTQAQKEKPPQVSSEEDIVRELPYSSNGGINPDA